MGIEQAVAAVLLLLLIVAYTWLGAAGGLRWAGSNGKAGREPRR